MTNPPPVAPVEGHYAMLRNGIIEKIGERKATLDGHIMFHAVNFNFRWFDSGKSYWDNGQYDIIATISPADMQAAANGELERLRAALQKLHEGLAWDWRGHPVGDLPTLREIARTALQGDAL